MPDTKREATNATDTAAYTGVMSYVAFTELPKTLSRKHLCDIVSDELSTSTVAAFQ
jgi:hypothetical protein